MNSQQESLQFDSPPIQISTCQWEPLLQGDEEEEKNEQLLIVNHKENPHHLDLSSTEYYNFVVRLCIAIFTRENFMAEINLGGLNKLWWTKEIDMLLYNFYSNVKGYHNEVKTYGFWDFTALQPQALDCTPHLMDHPQLNGGIKMSKSISQLNCGVSLYLIADGQQRPYKARKRLADGAEHQSLLFNSRFDGIKADDIYLPPSNSILKEPSRYDEVLGPLSKSIVKLINQFYIDQCYIKFLPSPVISGFHSMDKSMLFHQVLKIDTTVEIAEAIQRLTANKLAICNYLELNKTIHFRSFYLRNGSEYHRSYLKAAHPEPLALATHNLKIQRDDKDLQTRHEQSFIHDRNTKLDYGWMDHWRRLASHRDKDQDIGPNHKLMKSLPYVYDSSEKHHHNRHQFDGAKGCRLIHKVDFKEAFCKIFRSKNKTGNFLMPQCKSWVNKKFVYLEAQSVGTFKCQEQAVHGSADHRSIEGAHDDEPKDYSFNIDEKGLDVICMVDAPLRADA